MTFPGDTTFVLGAGFSVAAGFPLVRVLRERVIEFLDRKRGEPWTLCLEPEFHGYTRGEFQTGLTRVDPGGRLGFEELLIELSRQLAESERGDPCAATDRLLRKGCASLLWSIQDSDGLVLPCYKNFATRLRDSGGSAVITFNWDVLVEKALSEIDARWSYDLSARDVSVIKPHGSINWNGYRREELQPYYQGWQQLGDGSQLCYDRNKPFADPFPQDVNADLRYVIYPGDPELPNEDIDVAWLWKRAADAIKRSASIVFIGYSLPEYDSYAREFLLENARGKRLQAYTPSNADLDRYKQLFGDSIELRKQKFEDCEYAVAPA